MNQHHIGSHSKHTSGGGLHFQYSHMSIRHHFRTSGIFQKTLTHLRAIQEGYYVCVYEDPETGEISRLVYDSQAWIDAYQPGGADKWKDIDVCHPWDVAWKEEGIVKHTTEGGSPIWHFNKRTGGLATYIKRRSHSK